MIFNGNYDSSSIYIAVDPYTLTGCYQDGQTVCNNVVNSIDNINNTVSELKLGWVGKTADEAQAFNDKWQAAMIQLFGTKGDPSWGAVNQLLNAIYIAASNYSNTEAALYGDWGQIEYQLALQVQSLSMTSTNNSPPSNQSSVGLPIKETF